MAALKAMLPVYGTPCPPLILPRVLETKTALNPFLQVIPNAQPTHVMLQADLPTLDARLGQREAGRSLEHHRARTRELRTILAQAELDALPIDASANSPDSIAADILARTAWPEPPLTP